MKFDVIYIGNIDRLLDSIVDFSESRAFLNDDRYRWTPYYEYVVFSELRFDPYVLLWDKKRNEVTDLRIDTEKCLGGRTRLIIYCEDEEWPRLKKWWDLLSDYLVNEDLLDPVEAGFADDLIEQGNERSVETEEQITVSSSESNIYSDSLLNNTKPESPQPRVPKRGPDKTRWKYLWKKIKPMVEKGENMEMILSWLDKMHPKLPHSRDVIYDIIKAGAAGLLD